MPLGRASALLSGSEPPASELAERIDAVRLQLLTQSIQRRPLAALVAAAVGTTALWRAGWPPAAAAWLLALVLIHAGRRWQVRRWQQLGEAAPSPAAACRWLAGATLLQAVLLAVLVVAVFVGADPIGPYVVTALCMAVAAGAVGVAGWRPGVFLGWWGLVGGALLTGWLATAVWRAQPDAWAMAALTLSLLALLLQQVRDQQRVLQHMVALAWDNARLAERLREERDRTQATSASKTRFFAAASHDLRQPLHALSISASALSLLAQRQGDARIVRLSDGIDRALRQSNQLLDGLLDVSRLDAGAVQPALAPLDLAALLEGIVFEFAPLAAQRGLTLAVRWPGEPSSPPVLCVHTDAALLRRMLHNLVANALKFTAQGGVQLQVAAPLGGQVGLAVVDTGIGIAAEAQAHVFDEFYQADHPGRDRNAGLGLGLAIVRRSAALLALPLQLHSALGQGTTVTLQLPLAAAPAVASLAAADGDDAGLPPGLAVLVIDDEADIREALAALLQAQGCAVQAADGQAAALAALAAGFQPQVVVADHRLAGGASGLAAIAAVRGIVGPVPALVVTGDTAPQALQQVVASGHPVLHKPVDGHTLLRALAALVARP
jgi:signal transduction histidine kinase/CheY-like chemotaxis protein